MADLQLLIEAQENLGTGINKLYTNFKKTAKQRLTISFVNTRAEHLNEYWKDIKANHRLILDSCKKEQKATEPYFKDDFFGKLEDTYLEFKTLASEILAQYEQSEQSTSQKDIPPTHSTVNVTHKTKLPPISLPHFTGNYKDWMNFKELFTTLIHNDSQLSDIEKHHYLRTNLGGEADQLLRHFDITGVNYAKAWKTLEDRYNNKRMIVNNILSRFLQQKKLSNESPKGIKELIDSTKECLNSLENVTTEQSRWEAMVIHIMVSKLDQETHKGWEQSQGTSIELPGLEEFYKYLEGRFRAMEMLETVPKRESYMQTAKPKAIKSFSVEADTQCTFCSKSHYICHCPEFRELEVEQRIDFVKNNGLCFNCLVKGHALKLCKQHTSCKKCGRKHHTLLHRTFKNTVATVVNEEVGDDDENDREPIVSMKVETTRSQVVLATARILVKDSRGELHNLRALVDQGSQATLITEQTAQTLGLRKRTVEATITGISSKSILSNHTVTIEIFSTKRELVSRTQAHILKKLTHILPVREFDTNTFTELQNLELADPSLNKPGKIDVLLGADVYAEILLEGLHKHKSLIVQNSLLGWLLSGTANAQKTDLHKHHIQVATTLIDIDQSLRKFWEVEECTQSEKPLTNLDRQCEEHFLNTHTRDHEGRYIVRLPFKENFTERLGDTKHIAHNRLQYLQRKFTHNHKFKEDYTKFIEEYKELNHLEDVDKRDITDNKVYYIPHHAVVRETSATTKLRVVFDGSAKPTNGTSLNEELLIGPPLQQDIRDLIIRWRLHKIALLGDVKQMYRQILVDRRDCDYQRILWQDSLSNKLTEKRLLTVTYGTSCAPFLAIRVLKQLAVDEQSDFHDLVDIIKYDFYMDDILTGACDEDTAIKLQERVTQVMARAKFVMHKWASNSSKVLDNISTTNKSIDKNIHITMDETVKALGIIWNSSLDVFELKLPIFEKAKTIYTKTTVLSDIAKCFDPLGYMSPVIIKAKIFLQSLWLSGVGWSDELPTHLSQEWDSFRNELMHMEPIHLPRWYQCCPFDKLEVHGFSDASNAAYSAVVYLRVIHDENVYVSLVIAKTKVAPVKQVSLPRLELCGAVLLAKLLKDVKMSLKVKDDCVYAWTDSTIVLGWLRKNPNVWKTYVANRTTEILNVLGSDRWHHVKTFDNPADCASRGVNPSQLKSHELWWHGPLFLHGQGSISYPQITVNDTNLEVKTKVIHTNVVAQNDEMVSFLQRYSSLAKLLRVTGYILRFSTNCKLQVRTSSINKKIASMSSCLSVVELKEALQVCIKISQDLFYKTEIQTLAQGRSLPKSSKLFYLCPFLDDKSILRVGGRLHNANVNENLKRPILLSSKCNLAKLLVIDAHIRALHGGPLLTLNIVRKLYWIVGGRNLVKKVFRSCVQCFKQNPKSLNQFMGQLPPARVTPAKPFLSCGVDFAGPFTLKLYPGRCKRTSKAYICVYVCMATKAIHLELVSELSTAAFLASFRRFTARRGHCKDIWSDCATNFVGASKELVKMFTSSKAGLAHEIAELLSRDGTTWHFLAPSSPHMGGLWESAVKSVKTHIKRVINQTWLTFEEFSTLLCQVEACVNSRPLTPLSESPNDLLPLTPGHFLIGDSPLSVPEEDLTSVSIPPLERWQLLQKMIQSFWIRWRDEYLCTLQNRYKWQLHKDEPEIGTVVMIKDERLPPGKWLLGLIVDKHPGKDGLTRVVTLKHKNGHFQRPITKICPLPKDI